ncbi:Sugar or nucleoside kinase, ribokinase family [Alkalispirochaeta americana]|uniref:Sugar or nucleoside kinase, ribokinase family n=1 Tax=Alkalispirochaeta americana TaxID=159291 RepID=A0A1N6QDZ9_9SPIO|nr:adenosine kinase [Alkalispirochaeta americana]SIQ14770.1 Sugar or nucleoside kinase, ribokinase family [Alkalispirochaeta americana]
MVSVFGIGNPLIDLVFRASDQDLSALGLDKGIMHLVSQSRQEEILRYFTGSLPEYRPGGSAPNTLVALAGLGVSAVVAGKIGNDSFGEIYQQQVASCGITSRLVEGVGPTGSSIILVTPDGERTMNTHLGMCQSFSVADLDEALLKRSALDGGYLYFTGYMWDTESQKAAIRRAIEISRDAGGKVVFDLADPFAVERYREDFLNLLEHHVDVVFANRREAEILLGNAAGKGDPREMVQSIAQMVSVAALKVGKEGSFVADSQIRKIDARVVKALDTTGAGDMYAAGFLAGLVAGADPGQCGEIAGYLAEEVIQRVGAQFGIDEMRTLRSSLPGFLSL